MIPKETTRKLQRSSLSTIVSFARKLKRLCCTSIKESNLREFVNERQDDDQAIFLATLEDVFVTDDGDEKATRYVVGLFANTVEEATKIMIEYMRQGMGNLSLVSIKKTKIVDLLKV